MHKSFDKFKKTNFDCFINGWRLARTPLLNENASIQLLGNSTSSRTRTVDGYKKQVATNENCILWLINQQVCNAYLYAA